MPDRKELDRKDHGDDQGTRVGSPDTSDLSRRNQSRDATGAGSEAAEGIHSADEDRDPKERSGIASQPTGRGDAEPTGGRGAGREGGGNVERSGSEPLVDRDGERRSGYGGSGGKPVESSDQGEG
jgi:hypothetical protein